MVVGDSGLGKGSGIVHEEAGPVITSSESTDIGAEVGLNNTAELSGFAAALRWLLMEGGADAAVIRADSTYAGNLASGVWSQSQPGTGVNVQALWRKALRTLSVAQRIEGTVGTNVLMHLAARHALGEAFGPTDLLETRSAPTSKTMLQPGANASLRSGRRRA